MQEVREVITRPFPALLLLLEVGLCFRHWTSGLSWLQGETTRGRYTGKEEEEEEGERKGDFAVKEESGGKKKSRESGRGKKALGTHFNGSPSKVTRGFLSSLTPLSGYGD